MALDPRSPAAALPLGERLKARRWGSPTTPGRLLVYGMAAMAVAEPFQPAYWPLMVAMYLWMCLATTLYLHRVVSHRSLDLAGPLRCVLAIGTSVALGGDPIRWAAIHRHHHAFSDTPHDFHSPRHGFGHAHGLWAHKLDLAMVEAALPMARDVGDYWLHRWLFNPLVYPLPHFLVAGVLFALGGIGGLVWGLYVPLVALIQITHSVNSFGHMPRFGYRRFDTRDMSTNVPWLCLLSLGDSWHNNHHAHPRRAAHGLAWYELDLTTALIKVLERVGLARDVVWAGAEPPAPRSQEKF